MFQTTDENIAEKVSSLERQLKATQLKLNNVCGWIQLKFGENPSKSYDIESTLSKNVEGDVHEVRQFSCALDPAAVAPGQEAVESAIKIEEGDVTVSPIYNLSTLSCVESKLAENVQGAVYAVHEFSSSLDPFPVVPDTDAVESTIKIEEGDEIISTIYNLVSEHTEQDNEYPTPASLEIINQSNSKTTSNSSPGTTIKEKKVPLPKTIGYILFSWQVQNTVKAENPDKTFVEISRIIGAQWKSKTEEDKHFYEKQARKINKKNTLIANKATNSNESELLNEALQQRTIELEINSGRIFNCAWDTCDLEFEDAYNLIAHCVNEPNGHARLTYANGSTEQGFQCKWRKCARVKRGVQPFRSIKQLLNHIRQFHVLNGNGQELPSYSRKILPSGGQLFTSLSKTRKRKIATNPGMHHANFIPINKIGIFQFPSSESELESRCASFEEESNNLSDPLEFPAPESTVKQEWVFGVGKEQPKDYFVAERQECRECEIYLVDLKYLIPTTDFSATNTK